MAHKAAPYNDDAQKTRMSALIITLPPSMPAPATPVQAVWTEDGASIKLHVETPLALLPATANAEIVVLVAAAQLSWHRLALPKGTLERNFFQEGNASRVRAIVESLLEERVLDEPSQLHVALEPQARNGEPTWVAACDRSWLHAWLATLEQAGRPVSRIVPELAPLPDDSPVGATLHCLGTTAAAQWVYCSPHGVTLLPVSTSGIALLAQLQNGKSVAQVVAEPGVAALAEQHFQGRVSLQTGPQRAILAAQTSWDLAQFDLLRTRGTRTRKRLASAITSLRHSAHWRPARWAVLALLLVNLAGLQAWAWKEQSALAAKRAAVRDILQTTFPEVRVVVDAPLQMARSVADLQRQSGAASNGDMEPMLGVLQTVAPELGTPVAMEFVAGELRLKFTDASATALPTLAAKLQTHGYTAALDGDRLVLKMERRP